MVPDYKGEEDWKVLLEELENETKVEVKAKKAASHSKTKDRSNSKKSKNVKKSRQKVRSKPLLRLTILFIFVVVIGIAMFLFLRQVRSKVYVEAGARMIEANSFLYHEEQEAVFITDINTIDLSKPGQYQIELQLVGKDKIYQSTLFVQDTTPPSARAINPQVSTGTELAPEDFVENIQDVTAVKCSFEAKPDFSKKGEQKVTIILEDEAGNVTNLESILTVGDIRTHLLVEAGSKEMLSVEDFLLKSSNDVELLTDTSDIHLDTPGTYQVRIRLSEENYTCMVEVVDTMAPQGSAADDIVLWKGVAVTAEQLVKDVQDVSPVTVYFLDNIEPDVDTLGEQVVSIVLEDTYGNKTLITTPVTVKEDLEPPVIMGVNERTVYLEDKVAYKQDIYVEDNSGEEIEVEVDSSQMNISKIGSYTVIYTATDASGNTASESVVFTVTEKPDDAVTQEDVNIEADKVLDQIIKDSMTDEEKAKAVYDWCRNNIAYVNHSDKSSWIIGAYQAFTNFSGDCFNYFAAGKALLERLGIENIDIEKTNGGHYWSMINLGEGWYHFDVTPRVGTGDNFFMVTDRFLENYSANNGNSHIWDRDNYPATPDE